MRWCWRDGAVLASFCPRPRRSMATPKCRRKRRSTGATSIRWDRAACTTRRSGSPRRSRSPAPSVGGSLAGIVRIFNTYGPGMNPNDGRIVSTFTGQALRGEPITVHGDGDQTRSLCHVDDTVQGLMLMAVSDHCGPINLGNPDERTVREIAELIRDLAGSSSALTFGEPVADDPRRRCPDISRAGDLSGWKPRVPLEAGLAETIDWYRTHY